jgi:fucose 4-O-acetylase-like acetyltransferase
MNSLANLKRKPHNNYYTIAKGLAIILMVVGHSGCPTELRKFIYSFHMPLFFLLGGYFAKDVFSFEGFWSTTKKNAKRLLLPYSVTFILLLLWGFHHSIFKHEWSLVMRYVVTLFWASGDAALDSSGLITTGPTWFLIALFWTREFFYCIQVLANKLFVFS